jgi:hypothetical protein
MVTSQEMSENKMGNRGSKSSRDNMPLLVKEQRVDGSWYDNSRSVIAF